MSKESKMEPLEKTWILELVVVAVMTAILAALVGLWGWTANKVVQNGESIIEVRVEIGEVKAELGEKIAENGKSIAAVNGKIAAVDAKLDLLIRGLLVLAPSQAPVLGFYP